MSEDSGPPRAPARATPALGAGRLRVARQVVVEVTAVAFLGGMVGLGLSGVSLSALVALLPPEMPRVTQIGMSPLVALFAVACMVFATLTVSWITAGRALREVAGGLGARDLAGPHGRRLRSLLVGVETALAIVLVVGAGLLMRSLIAVAAVDPGFDPSGVVTFRPTPTSSAYPNASIERFYADLAEGLERLPAVASVGAIQFLPMTPGAWWGSYRLEGDADVDESRRTGMRVTAGDYFDAMRISIVAGRSFDEPERGGEGPPVAVVNERFARDAFGAEPAVGRTVLLPGVDEGVRVIGVVADVRQSDLYTETHPEMYVPLPRVPWRRMHVVVRVDGDPGAVLDAARAVVAELDPNAPVLGPTLLSDIVEDTFGRARLYATMMVVFGALGLALGAVGIYGVTAQSVVERRREIGIRLALGAERPSVVGRTVLEGLGPVAVGLAVGLALVVAGAGWLEGLLFGVGTRDPGTLLGAPLLLVVVALTALLLPAVRAAGVDPVATLREE